MNKPVNFLSAISLASASLFAVPAAAQETGVLVTSSVQALDASTVKTMLNRAHIKNTYDPVAKADRREGAKALVIAFGVRIKGFGAAGITAEAELVRTSVLLAEAKKRGIEVIGVHIGGMDRREGLSKQFVQLVASKADALAVWKNSAGDGFFTKTAADRGVPLVLIDLPMKVGDAIAEQLPKS